jgi:DNA-binding transcriptional LysR family regulator
MDYRWDDIRLFLALHRERTLSAAGHKLGLDGSTMSRRLAAFEEVLGRTLFDRSRDGLLPTPAASDLLPLAEAMELASQRFREHVEALDSAPEGVVRLTTPPSVAETFVVPELPELFTRYPRLRLDIDTSQRRLDLSRGEADLALRDSAQAAGDVVVTRLMRLEFAILAAPSLAQRIGTIARWDAVPWISWGAPVGHLAPAAWLATHAPRVEPMMRSSSLGAQLAGARHGLGVILIPRVFARTGELVAVELSPELEASVRSFPVDELWLAAARSRRALPRVGAVWDFLVERARELNLDPAQASKDTAPS